MGSTQKFADIVYIVAELFFVFCFNKQNNKQHKLPTVATIGVILVLPFLLQALFSSSQDSTVLVISLWAVGCVPRM